MIPNEPETVAKSLAELAMADATEPRVEIRPVYGCEQAARVAGNRALYLQLASKMFDVWLTDADENEVSEGTDIRVVYLYSDASRQLQVLFEKDQHLAIPARLGPLRVSASSPLLFIYMCAMNILALVGLGAIAVWLLT